MSPSLVIGAQLARSDRPLIIDDAQYLLRKRMIELTRDIYESSQAPVITCKPLAAFLRGASKGIRQPSRVKIGRLSRHIAGLGVPSSERGLCGLRFTRR